MIQIEFEPSSLKLTLAALDALAGDSWLKKVLEDSKQSIGQATKQRYDKASATTPYSPGYIGKKKPTGKIAGGAGDLGFGKDSLALYSDLLFTFELDDTTTLANYSDLPYAGYIDGLVEQKTGQGLYADDETYLALLDMAVGDAVEDIWKE